MVGETEGDTRRRVPGDDAPDAHVDVEGTIDVAAADGDGVTAGALIEAIAETGSDVVGKESFEAHHRAHGGSVPRGEVRHQVRFGTEVGDDEANAATDAGW